jgi:hypothetical protein
MKAKLFLIYALFSLFICCSTKIEKEFYNNGTLKSIIKKNRNGQICGKAKYYYEDGSIKSTEEYLNGELKTKTVYFSNGMKKWTADFRKGKMNGTYHEYSENGFLIFEGDVSDNVFIRYNKYDSLKLVFKYIRLDSIDIPQFNSKYIQLEEKLYTNKFSKIKFQIPTIPSDQILPYISSGTIRVINRQEGLWEAKARPNADSVIIGISVFIDDSTRYFVGQSKFLVVK